MISRNYRKAGGFIFLLLFLLACASSATGNPSAPTAIPPAQSQKTLEALIMQTSAAAQTQTATVLPPTLTPTITRTPSKTPTAVTVSPTFFYSLFTATFDIKVEATDASLNATAQYVNSIGAIDLGNGDIRTIERMWACYVRYNPSLKVRQGEKFYAGWEVMNIGSEAWSGNTVDFVYRSGYLHEGRRRLDLQSTVGSGKLLLIGVYYIAPKRIGEYHAHWILKVGNNEFCVLKLDFQVEK